MKKEQKNTTNNNENYFNDFLICQQIYEMTKKVYAAAELGKKQESGKKSIKTLEGVLEYIKGKPLDLPAEFLEKNGTKFYNMDYDFCAKTETQKYYFLIPDCFQKLKHHLKFIPLKERAQFTDFSTEKTDFDFISECNEMAQYVGHDELRPNMMGVYFDFANGCKCATDAHILKVAKIEKSDRENAIIDPKNGMIKDGKFPEYQFAIPTKGARIELGNDFWKTFKSVPKSMLGYNNQIRLDFSSNGYHYFRSEDLDFCNKLEMPFNAGYSFDFDFSLGFDYNFLSKIAKEKPNYMYVSAPNRAVVFTSDNNDNILLLMPVILNGYWSDSGTPFSDSDFVEIPQVAKDERCDFYLDLIYSDFPANEPPAETQYVETSEFLETPKITDYLHLYNQLINNIIPEINPPQTAQKSEITMVIINDNIVRNYCNMNLPSIEPTAHINDVNAPIDYRKLYEDSQMELTATNEKLANIQRLLNGENVPFRMEYKPPVEEIKIYPHHNYTTNADGTITDATEYIESYKRASGKRVKIDKQKAIIDFFEDKEVIFDENGVTIDGKTHKSVDYVYRFIVQGKPLPKHKRRTKEEMQAAREAKEAELNREVPYQIIVGGEVTKTNMPVCTPSKSLKDETKKEFVIYVESGSEEDAPSFSTYEDAIEYINTNNLECYDDEVFDNYLVMYVRKKEINKQQIEIECDCCQKFMFHDEDMLTSGGDSDVFTCEHCGKEYTRIQLFEIYVSNLETVNHDDYDLPF